MIENASVLVIYSDEGWKINTLGIWSWVQMAPKTSLPQRTFRKNAMRGARAAGPIPIPICPQNSAGRQVGNIWGKSIESKLCS